MQPHRDSSYLEHFGYFDDKHEAASDALDDVGGVSDNDGRFVRALCLAGNVCLALIGLLTALLPRLMLTVQPHCCLTSAVGLGATVGVAAMPLAAGLAGLTASIASRRRRAARRGHAVSAVLTVGFALLPANAGVLLAKEPPLAERLLTTCGGIRADWRAILGIGASSALILLIQSGLSWTCYYKYARAAIYDGEYNLAKLRRQRWRQMRLRQLHRQQQQLVLMRQHRQPLLSGRSHHGNRGMFEMTI